MKIECPRCGEQVEYRPGAVQVCSYCKVSLQLPDVNQLPEHLRHQWFREQAAAKAKEEKLRKKAEAEERWRKAKEQQAVRERQLVESRTELQKQRPAEPPSLTGQTKISPGKSFLDRIVYALDPKFERYITPQIIRVFWVLSLVLTFLGVLIYALGGLQTALPRKISVPNPRSDEVVYRESIIADLIEDKQFERMMAESRREEPQESTEPSPIAVDDKPKKLKPDFEDIQNEYEKMSLEQLRATLEKLEREHPSHRTEWVYQHTVLYPLWVAAAAVAAVLSLLVLRMVCEFLCVVFNIATHLNEVRQSLSIAARV